LYFIPLNQEKTQPQSFCANAFFVKNTLSVTPRPLYHWKAKDLSFLHVLLAMGVNLGILLNKKRQNSSCVSFVQNSEVSIPGIGMF
jgi:hypothetical protein